MRRMLFPLFLFILETSNAVAARKWPGKYCLDGCDLTLNYVDFNDTNSALSKKSRTCRSVLHAKSLYLCIDAYCDNEDDKNIWLMNVNDTCKTTSGEPMPPWSVIEDYTPEEVAKLRRLRAEEGMWNSKNPPLNEVVIPEGTFFERAFRTLDYACFEVDTHWAYGVAMFYFWAVVISTGICWRLATVIQEFRHREWQPIPAQETDVEGFDHPERNSPLSLPYATLKRYIIIPATFGYRCSQNLGWCTIPPRIQSLTIFSFVIINLVLCSISYRVFSGNLYWPLISTQLWRYVSDRTGAIALANFPLIWLFGTRNHLLMWLTGWGFGTYNNFHRWVARVATVQAVVHSIGYTEMIFERGDWSLFMKYWSKHYFWNGEVATILMCAISAFSVYGLRRCHYEFFLITHIILSVIVLLTTFYHVEIFNGEWNIFIWPCLLIWVLDRALRIFRILAFNWRFWDITAMATYDAASNLIRLEIPCEQSILKPQPGTYYYIYVLNNILFAHQNHPFTLAYVSSPNHTDINESGTQSYVSHPSPIQPSRSSPSPPARTPSPAISESSSLLLPPHPTSLSPSLTFLIRPYEGITSRLRKTFLNQPRTLRVWVEGPYGTTTTPHPLHAFPALLFIAGGTGIAVTLSHLPSLLASTPQMISIHVVWAVREHAFLGDVLRRDIPAEVLLDERVRFTVHVTQDAELKDDVALGGEGGEGSGLLGDRLQANVEVKAGRPDVNAAVAHEAKVASGKRLAVVACGPAQMADDARRGCVRALGKGFRGVEYFEESFKW